MLRLDDAMGTELYGRLSADGHTARRPEFHLRVERLAVEQCADATYDREKRKSASASSPRQRGLNFGSVITLAREQRMLAVVSGVDENRLELIQCGFRDPQRDNEVC
jgi:hypothetical protein